MKALYVAGALLAGIASAEAARFCHCWVQGGIQYCRCY